MANLVRSLRDMWEVDDLARKNTPIHRIHPLAKTLVTLSYVIVVTSFSRYEISGLLPLVFYPVLVLCLADLPLGVLLKRILCVELFVILIGILNPVYDCHVFELGGVAISWEQNT